MTPVVVDEEFTYIRRRIASQYKLPPEIIGAALYFYEKLSHYHNFTKSEKAVASFITAIKTIECLPVNDKDIIIAANIEDAEEPFIQSTLRFAVSTRHVLKMYRKLIEEQHCTKKSCYLNPAFYIKVLCDRLQSSKRLYGDAMRIFEKCKQNKYARGNPIVVASGCLYLANIQLAQLAEDEKWLYLPRLTQRDIALVARITECSVRRSYQEITKKLGIKDCPVDVRI